MSVPSTEYVEVRGERVEVDKTEHTSLISQTASQMSISPDEAWELVKEHLAGALSEQPASPPARRPAKTHTGGAPPSPLPTSCSPASTPNRETTSSGAPSVDVSGLAPVLHLRGAPLSAITGMAPQEFGLQEDQSVFEAIGRGFIKLGEEPPDVAILRAAAGGLLDFGVVSPSRREAMDLVQQRQYTFPFHETTVRIMPSDLSKTSLFHVASNNTPRRFCRDEPLGRIGDSVDAVYYGEELRHDDELVLMQLLHEARRKYPYELININNVKFFKGSRGVSRVASGKDTASVIESLKRLRGGYLIITTKGKPKSYLTVNLVSQLAGSGTTHVVQIDPVLVLLCSSWKAIDTEYLFRTSGVARQLLKYVSTIPTVYESTMPIKTLSLFELCYGKLESLAKYYKKENPDRSDGDIKISLSKKVSDFRRKNLPAGLNALKSIGAIQDWSMDAKQDKVVIFRSTDAARVQVSASPGE
jgi:hypothetical protein